MKNFGFSNIYFNIFCAVFICLLASIVSAFAHDVLSERNYKAITSNARNQGELVVKLSEGFVRAYSSFAAEHADGLLPSPAIFRGHALELTDLVSLFDGSLYSEVVGFQGKSIAREPTDDAMRDQMLLFQQSSEAQLALSTFMKGDTTIHRSMWPFYATDNTCIDCHNRFQQFEGPDQWQLGDLMGAQVVEKDISDELIKYQNEATIICALIFFSFIAISYCFIFIFRQAYLAKNLKVLASTDSMTGCINQREMYRRVAKLPKKISGSLLMLDIDHFKQINDNYGHAAGDVVIQAFATHIQRILRSEDWVARIGGEEFLVLLPNITPQEVLAIAERLREQTQASTVEWDDIQITYTISIGVHSFKDASSTHFKEWVKEADRRLYQAKNEGRNRVVS